jgi:hypothetical protein
MNDAINWKSPGGLQGQRSGEARRHQSLVRSDLVRITAFTSQANRAYEVAAHFRRLGVPVVMGGTHATMCQAEVMERVEQGRIEK